MLILNKLNVSLLFTIIFFLSSCGGEIDVDSAIVTREVKELEIIRLETSLAGARENYNYPR